MKAKTLELSVKFRRLGSNSKQYDMIISYKFAEDNDANFLEAHEITDTELLEAAAKLARNLYPIYNFELKHCWFYDFELNEYTHSMLGKTFVISHYVALTKYQINQCLETLMHAQDNSQAILVKNLPNN